VESLGHGPRALRRSFRDAEVLISIATNVSVLGFSQDYAFDLASAAAVVSGDRLTAA
jgi:hypothetical protein